MYKLYENMLHVNYLTFTKSVNILMAQHLYSRTIGNILLVEP
jgi:hypothetical protein